MALHRPQQGSVCQVPQAYLAGRSPDSQQFAIPIQCDRARVIERLCQHAIDEVRINKPCVLRIHLRQVGVPNRQARQVETTQIAAQQPQQVYHVSRSACLLVGGPSAPVVEQP